MSTDLEEDLRELFAADAARAPRAHDLALRARARAGLQRRAQRRIAVGASVVVAVSVVSSVALLTGSSSHRSAPPASNRPDPSTSEVSSSPWLGPVVPETPALYYRNLEVPVPAAMLSTDAVRCGTPVADAAYIIGPPYGSRAYGVRACLPTPAHPEQITTVVLQPWDAPSGVPAPAPGTHVLADGRTQMVTAVPGSDLRFIVTSPDAKRAQQLFNGLLIISMAHGCEVRDSGNHDDPLPDADQVSGGSGCVYDSSGWLTASGWMDAAQASSAVDALRLTREVTTCPGPPPRPSDGFDHWTVHLRTPTGERVLSAGWNTCQTGPLKALVSAVTRTP